jgi:peptidoglycan/LPS O-acetylase OafA/YrhL
LPALDGLRAISILWVLSVHWPVRMGLSKHPLVMRGALGVEIFFAVSGFLVTRSLQQCVVRAQREGRGKGAVVRDFLARRVARIWPPYFLALAGGLLAVFVDPALRPNLGLVMHTVWSFPAFLANYTIPYYGAPLSLFLMWSLCFEEQFYLILIALYVAGGQHLTRYLVALACASIVLRIAFGLLAPAALSAFVLQMETHWRFDAIAWGCLAWIYRDPIANFWRTTRVRRLLEALVVLGAVLACIPNPSNMAVRAIWYLPLAPLFTALITALCFSPGFWLARVLAWAPLVFVGTVSYEIYLSHIITFRMLSRLGLERAPLLYYVLTIAGAILGGWLFHRFYSRRTQALVRRWFDSRPSAALVAASRGA